MNKKKREQLEAIIGKSNDEAYTTYAEAEKLAKYIFENKLISKHAKIWMPFDNRHSRIYKAFKDCGFNNLILTNLEIGKDFYHFEPKKWDLIITNPPFSNRTALLNRLFYLDKPFIVLQPIQLFNNQRAIHWLCEKDGELAFLLPRTRMKFMRYNEKENLIETSSSSASFYSFWLLYKIKRGGCFYHY